jgi:hypothetical protein
LPDDVAAQFDAKAAVEGWPSLDACKLAFWLGLVAIEDKGGLRKAAIALGYAPGEWPEGVYGVGRPIKVPRDARDLVGLARREGVPWQAAQRLALMAGLATIEARGGLKETRRQVEALKRSVVSQGFGGRAG